MLRQFRHCKQSSHTFRKVAKQKTPVQRHAGDYSELDELVLAYAVSIHKSRGSEYPVVVMPLVMSHYIMLQRNLLYTGLTRGKELVIVIGSKKAMSISINNNKTMKRNTLLRERLM